jgi:hypothetical protein
MKTSGKSTFLSWSRPVGWRCPRIQLWTFNSRYQGNSSTFVFLSAVVTVVHPSAYLGPWSLLPAIRSLRYLQCVWNSCHFSEFRLRRAAVNLPNTCMLSRCFWNVRCYDNHVIQVQEAGLIMKNPQDGFHREFECCRSAAVSKGHNYGLPQPLSRRNCCLLLLAGMGNLPAASLIYGRESLGPNTLIPSVVYSR